MMNQVQKLLSPQLLLLGKWLVFVAAIVLDWTGHLSQRSENIVETMLFALAGVNIASHLGGKVGSTADVLSRLQSLEQSVASGDGTTPPVPAAVSSVIPQVKPAG